MSLIWRLTQTKNMRASYALSPKMLISQVKYLLSSGRARSQAERLERRASKEIITDTEVRLYIFLTVTYNIAVIEFYALCFESKIQFLGLGFITLFEL